MIKVIKILTLMFFVTLLVFLKPTLAQEYQVDLTKETIVKFISDAPIEEFEGITNNIDGYIKLNSFDNVEDSEIYLEVDLNTLDTGIGLRNRHMRENYLETDKYQYTYFQGQFDSIKKNSETEYSVIVTGKLFIHGENNDIEVEGIIIRNEVGLRINCLFDIKLSDYKIDIPQMMFMKINETMNLELNFSVKEIEDSYEN